MGVESPQTYGEHYWAMQVEAEKSFQDDVEKEVGSYVAAIFRDLGVRDVLPSSVGNYVDKMTGGSSFAWGSILARFGSEMADSILGQSMGHALKDFNFFMAEKFHDERIDPSMANLLYQRKNITKEFWASSLLSFGYDLPQAIHAYGASLPYPSIADIMLYTRYHDEGKISRDEVWKYFDVPADEFHLWEWLTKQRITTLDAHTLLRRGLLDESKYLTELSKIGWDSRDSILLKDVGWTVPNAMLLVQGDLMQEQSTDRIIADISIADIHPKYSQTYLDAILTKPSSQDVIAYELRQDPDLSALAAKLRKIGIHPDYAPLYKELAHPIPPVADIITMAVREAFTPAIAARFGQYEDLPPEYVEWVQKKGLSKEWAERYWAAHWSLPSAQQGFEMVHRGAIELGDLDMLLRALDVMPFWRDKLTKIAYRRLSRVDIRRMYRVGVLNEQEVLEAYTELGYNPRDAKRMTEFTLKQVLATQSKFTSANIVKAYAAYQITSSEAGSLLREIGVRSENVSIILSQAEYKREWELTDDRIGGIRNLYKKRVYDDNKASSELLKLNLPAKQAEVLMSQWYFEEKEITERLWSTAQTLSFAKAGLITKERAIKELGDIGFDTEHIDIYMRSVKWAKPKT